MVTTSDGDPDTDSEGVWETSWDSDTEEDLTLVRDSPVRDAVTLSLHDNCCEIELEIDKERLSLPLSSSDTECDAESVTDNDGTPVPERVADDDSDVEKLASSDHEELTDILRLIDPESERDGPLLE